MKTASELIDLLGGPAAVARRVGVKPPSVHEWRARSIPDDKLMLLGADIEAVTGGEVMRWDLFPESWHRVWPELIGIEGAPGVEGIAAPGLARAGACTCGAWEMSDTDSVPVLPAEGEHPPPPPGVADAPAAAMLLGGRREEDHAGSDFGALDANGPTLAAEIAAISVLSTDHARGEGGDAV